MDILVQWANKYVIKDNFRQRLLSGSYIEAQSEEDTDEECKYFDETYKTTVAFRFTSFLYRLYSFVSVVEIKSSFESAESSHTKLHFRNPFKERGINLLLYILVNCLTAKLLLVMIYNLSFILLIYDYHHELMVHANQTIMASLCNDSLQVESAKDQFEFLEILGPEKHQGFLEKLEEYKSLQFYLGNLFVELNFNAVGTIGSILVIVFFYYQFGQFCLIKHGGFWSDFLGFLQSPQNEVRRVKLEANELIKDLILTSENREAQLNEQNYQLMHKKHAKAIWSLFQIETYLRSLNWRRNCKILTKIWAGDMIKPNNLNHRLHYAVLLFSQFTLILATIEGLIGGLFICAFFSFSEANAHAQYRFKLIECEQSQQSQPSEGHFFESNFLKAMFLKSLNFLNNQTFRSAEERRLYLDHFHRNNQRVDFSLVMYEAVKFYSNCATIWSMVEFMLVCAGCSLWISFYSSTYVLTHIHKAIWLDQVHKMTQNCNSMLNQSVVNNDLFAEQLTIAYIHFELFRRRQNQHQRFMSFMFIQAFLATSISMLAVFVLGSIVESKYLIFILIVLTIFTFLLNCFLLCGSLISSKLIDLMKSLNTLVARCNRSRQLQDLKCLNLWRRQLVSADEIRQTYGPKVLGISIAYNKLLALNLYLGALYVLVILR